MDEELLDYKVFLEMLELPDDKISLLLYDLYQYKLSEDRKELEMNKE